MYYTASPQFGQLPTAGGMPGPIGAAMAGPYWPAWSTSWRRGLASLLVPPGYNAWNRDPQSATASTNLATMYKRIEEIRRDRGQRDPLFRACGVVEAA